MRSESPDIAIELSLQPWRAFKPDGVIFFSDILTPLPALGIEFDVIKGKGPVISDPVRSLERVKALRPLLDPSESLPFIQTILSTLRQEFPPLSTLVHTFSYLSHFSSPTLTPPSGKSSRGPRPPS